MAEYQELAERLLSRSMTAAGGPELAQLFLGEIPPDLPLTVPLPDGASLLGSIGRRVNGRRTSVEVVLDGPGPPEAVLDFYQRELSRQGWNPPVPGPDARVGGFMPTARTMSRAFCRGPQGPWVGVTVVETGSGVCEVRLRLELANPGPCAPPPARGPEGRAHTMLPALFPPPGVRWRGGGGGGSDQSWYSEGTAETDLSAAELAAHFAPAFEAAGWTPAAAGAEGGIGWRAWRRADDGEWYAFLLVVEATGSRQRTMLVRVANLSGGPGSFTTEYFGRRG